MTKRKLAVLLSALFILVIGLSACGNKGSESASKEAESLKVGYLPSTGAILYFIANDAGFFEEEGLDVQLVQFNNSGEGINALQQKKIDIGAFGTAPPLNFISQGYDITIIGGQMSEGHALIAKQEDSQEFASDLKNLKGKKVASIRLNTGDVVFRQAFISEGLSVGTEENNDVQIVELTSAADVIEAVKNGTVDSGLVWTPYRKTAEQQGLKIVKYTSEIAGAETAPCCRQIVNTELLEGNEEKYVSTLRALIKAYDYLQNNQEGSLDIAQKYVQVDRDILQEEIYGKYIGNNPDPDRNAIVNFWNYMKEIDYIDSDLDIDEHINITLYKKALDSLVEENPDNQIYKTQQTYYTEHNL